MIVIDGGYLSWTYGSSDGRILAWQENKVLYGWQHTQHMIILDSERNHREVFFPEYKGKRRLKRESDVEWMLKTEKVRYFRRTVLRKDPDLSCVQFDGLEADDAIALLAQEHYRTLGKPLKVIGVDKDLLQLGDALLLKRLDGSRVTLDNYRARLPKALTGFPRLPQDVPLLLSLMGDKSDSIPRLIPPRQLQIAQEILRADDPYQEALEWYGEALLTNLALTILPGPWCYDPEPTPGHIFHMLHEGSYGHGLRLRRDLSEWLLAIDYGVLAAEEEDGEDGPFLYLPELYEGSEML